MRDFFFSLRNFPVRSTRTVLRTMVVAFRSTAGRVALLRFQLLLGQLNSCAPHLAFVQLA